MLDEELAPLLKQQGIAETAAGGVTVNASEQDRSTAEDGSLRDFLCHRATWLQLVDLLQLSEFLAFATYACCGDRRSLTDLLLRQMEKLEVTKEQLEVHFAAFTYTESLTMLRWREKLYEFPALSLINGTSANWKALAMSTKTPKGNSKYLAYDDSNDLQRKNMILARLEAHEKSYPELRLDILEVGELRDLRASEFFWCAPKPEFCERVAQILSVALRDADARESNERLDYFLIAPPRDVLAEAAATSAAVLRLEAKLKTGMGLTRCSAIGGIPVESIVGKLAIAEEFDRLKYPQKPTPKPKSSREDRKAFIMSRLMPMSLKAIEEYARSLRLTKVRLGIGGYSNRTLDDVRRDIAEAILGPERDAETRSSRKASF